MKYQANPVIVDAFVILKVEDGKPCVADPAAMDIELTLDSGQVVRATREMTARMTPVPGDYWVIQSDRYIYLNPKDVFERKYSRVPDFIESEIKAFSATQENVETLRSKL